MPPNPNLRHCEDDFAAGLEGRGSLAKTSTKPKKISPFQDIWPMESSHILFQERQRFSSVKWIWFIIIPIWITSVIIATISHKDKGTTYADFLTAPVTLLLILVLLFTLRLDTEIHPDGIYVRFFPLVRTLKRYGWEEIEKVYIRQYNPIGEYGGWGIRFGRNGRALNVSGNKGIQLELKNGKRLLIGTKQPDKAKAILEATFNKAD